jgi:CRP-like cAMP-binding protein
MPALQSLYQHPLLSAQDLKTIFEAHYSVSFKKGDFLMKKGQVASAYFCVEHGLIRSYVYDYNGNDITTGFVGKNQIAIDVVSLFHRVATVEYFQALTDCECYAIDLDTFQRLYHSITGLSEWGRAWMSSGYFNLNNVPYR